MLRRRQLLVMKELSISVEHSMELLASLGHNWTPVLHAGYHSNVSEFLQPVVYQWLTVGQMV